MVVSYNADPHALGLQTSERGGFLHVTNLFIEFVLNHDFISNCF